MSEEPAYILSINGLNEELASEHEAAVGQGRPWIGVQFECCGVYARIYRNQQGTAYLGNCPRCGRQVTVRVGPGGTTARLFRAH